MWACISQPHGGSDARADFAEQVAVHVDFRMPSSSGGDSGPERRPKAGASTLSSPEAPLAARGASKILWILYSWA